MEKQRIFLFMAQPEIRYKSVPDNCISMFPFGMGCKSYAYQTETLKLPKTHLKYSPVIRKNKVYSFKGHSHTFVNGKRYEYELKYRDFESQKTLGDKIRFLRLHAGLTKQQLADMVGVHITCINDYELNYIDISFVKTDILYKIEQACNTSRYILFNDYLLYYETDLLSKDMIELDIKQKDLAVYFDVDRHTISRWQHKKCRPSIDIWRSTLKLFQHLRSLPKSDRSLYLSSKGKSDLLRTDCAAKE